MNVNDIAMAYGSVVNKAWTDPDFKAQLGSDPKGALKSIGFDVPADMDVEVLESTSSKVYLALPPQPGQLSTAQLDQVAGGYRQSAPPGWAPDPAELGGGGSTYSDWSGQNSKSDVTKLY